MRLPPRTRRGPAMHSAPKRHDRMSCWPPAMTCRSTHDRHNGQVFKPAVLVAAWHASRAPAACVIRTGRAAALRIDRGVTHSRDMQCVHSMSPSLGGERESLHRAARHPQKAGRESLVMKWSSQRATSTRNCVAGRVLRLDALAQRSTLLAMTRQRRSTRLMTCTAQSSYVSRASASECDQAWKTTCKKAPASCREFFKANSRRLATDDAYEMCLYSGTSASNHRMRG